MNFEYKLTRSKRKTVCITVHHDASVEVRAPLKMKSADIESFVKSKEKWIEKAIAGTVKTDDISYDGTFPFLGDKYIISPSQGKNAEISKNMLLVPESTDMTAALNVFLKQQAKCYIPGRVENIARQTGITPSSVMINNAKSHWGSCTRDRLHFSCYLMLADRETIDYVIIHELVHILHHNHSALFWAEVKKHCPDYIELRNRLKSISGYVEKLQNNK